jgi:hypothetical protein
MVASYRTWEDHLRQHTGRLTGADREHEERALSYTEGYVAAHLLPPVPHEPD